MIQRPSGIWCQQYSASGNPSRLETFPLNTRALPLKSRIRLCVPASTTVSALSEEDRARGKTMQQRQRARMNTKWSIGGMNEHIHWTRMNGTPEMKTKPYFSYLFLSQNSICNLQRKYFSICSRLSQHFPYSHIWLQFWGGGRETPKGLEKNVVVVPGPPACGLLSCLLLNLASRWKASRDSGTGKPQPFFSEMHVNITFWCWWLGWGHLKGTSGRGWRQKLAAVSNQGSPPHLDELGACVDHGLENEDGTFCGKGERVQTSQKAVICREHLVFQTSYSRGLLACLHIIWICPFSINLSLIC